MPRTEPKIVANAVAPRKKPTAARVTIVVLQVITTPNNRIRVVRRGSADFTDSGASQLPATSAVVKINVRLGGSFRRRAGRGWIGIRRRRWPGSLVGTRLGAHRCFAKRRMPLATWDEPTGLRWPLGSDLGYNSRYRGWQAVRFPRTANRGSDELPCERSRRAAAQP